MAEATQHRAIDPATGDYWLPSQPEYWDCAAQAWRDVMTFGTRQEDARQAGIRTCAERASALRAKSTPTTPERTL